MPSYLSALTGRERGNSLIKVFTKVTDAVRQRTDYEMSLDIHAQEIKVKVSKSP
jgi:hypothetical protein